MLTFVKSQLKSLNNEASSKEFSHLVDVMCNWGRGEDLFEFITEHIQGSLMVEQPNLETSTRGRGNHFKKLIFGLELIEILFRHKKEASIV